MWWSRGCGSFPTALRLQVSPVVYRGRRSRAPVDLVVFYSATLFHGSCHSFTFPLAGESPASAASPLIPPVYRVHPRVDSYLISNSSPSSHPPPRSPRKNDACLLSSSLRCIALSFYCFAVFHTLSSRYCPQLYADFISA